ncbi:hypothetical protein LWI29_007185 [Acer saccharum]|uniref:Protein FAR1-RELATED SEQUENCE n=1 Tax=Acer saccharum TaxID=4024 RepID=A0AA39SI85_ACESA|nr:hypothetical protein LWI29_007185 [Acer saccharum]
MGIPLSTVGDFSSWFEFPLAEESLMQSIIIPFEMATDVIGLKCLNEKPKLKCGLEFDSEQSAYDFYNAYRRSMGFSVRKDTFGKNKRTGELTSRIFVFVKRVSERKISEMF